VPSYGLAIVRLEVVIRPAPVSTQRAQSQCQEDADRRPVMAEGQAEIKARHASDPKKHRKSLGKLMKEFGQPPGGFTARCWCRCRSFSRSFATLRGSPFADVPHLER